MIAVLKNGTSQKQIDNLINWIESQGLSVHLSTGEYQTIVGLIGDTTKIDEDLLQSLDIVVSVVGVGYLRGANLSTRGPGWTNLWFTGCGASCTAGYPRSVRISAESI